MRRLAAILLASYLFATWNAGRAADDDDDKKAAKEALQALNDYIGTWKGSGGPEKVRPDPE